MAKVLLTKNNSSWGIRIYQQRDNVYKDVINFVDDKTKNEYLALSLFGDKNFDFKKELEERKDTKTFIRLDEKTAQVIINRDDYPEYSLNQMLNKDYIIIKEDGEIFYYVISSADRGVETNNQTIIYSLEIDIFMSYDILNNLKGEWNILNTHLNRLSQDKLNFTPDQNMSVYNSFFQERDYNILSHQILEKRNIESDYNGYDAWNESLKNNLWVYVFEKTADSEDGDEKAIRTKAYLRDEKIIQLENNGRIEEIHPEWDEPDTTISLKGDKFICEVNALGNWNSLYKYDKKGKLLLSKSLSRDILIYDGVQLNDDNIMLIYRLNVSGSKFNSIIIDENFNIIRKAKSFDIKGEINSFDNSSRNDNRLKNLNDNNVLWIIGNNCIKLNFNGDVLVNLVDDNVYQYRQLLVLNETQLFIIYRSHSNFNYGIYDNDVELITKNGFIESKNHTDLLDDFLYTEWFSNETILISCNVNNTTSKGTLFILIDKNLNYLNEYYYDVNYRDQTGMKAYKDDIIIGFFNGEWCFINNNLILTPLYYNGDYYPTYHIQVFTDDTFIIEMYKYEFEEKLIKFQMNLPYRIWIAPASDYEIGNNNWGGNKLISTFNNDSNIEGINISNWCGIGINKSKSNALLSWDKSNRKLNFENNDNPWKMIWDSDKECYYLDYISYTSPESILDDNGKSTSQTTNNLNLYNIPIHYLNIFEKGEQKNLENEIGSLSNGLKDTKIGYENIGWFTLDNWIHSQKSYKNGKSGDLVLELQVVPDGKSFVERLSILNINIPMKPTKIIDNKGLIPFANDQWEQYLENNRGDYRSKQVSKGIGALAIIGGSAAMLSAPFTGGMSMAAWSGSVMAVAGGSSMIYKSSAGIQDIQRTPDIPEATGLETLNNITYNSTALYLSIAKTQARGNIWEQKATEQYLYGSTLNKTSNSLYPEARRKIFNYIEIEDMFSNVNLDLSSSIKQLISDTFLSGLTIWHCDNVDTFKGIRNYTDANDEV